MAFTLLTHIQKLDIARTISTSATPHNIRAIWSEQLRSLDSNIAFTQQNLNARNINSHQGKQKLIQDILIAERNEIQITENASIPSGYLLDLRGKMKLYEINPPYYESDLNLTSKSRNFYLESAIFKTPKVTIKCTGELYIENTYFGENTEVIINDRKLTHEEVNHISANILSKCPIINMEITLLIDYENFINEDKLRSSLSSIEDIKPILRRNIIQLNKMKDNLLLRIEQMASDMDKCDKIFVDKIIDIPCSGVDDFDFMSV